MQLRPLNPHIGVEVSGLDLKRPIDGATAAALRGALNEHLLLLLRGQDVSADEQNEFGRVFGEVHLRTKYSVPVAVPLAQFVSNVRDDGILGDVELLFHQDHCFYEIPLKGLMLYAIEIPKSGSVTLFRNTVALHDDLPAALRERASKVRNFFDGSLTPPYDPSKSKAEQPSAWHPYFWTDPESGKKTLLASPTTIARSDTATPEEGKQLMREIWDYAAGREDLVYAHHWAPGDLVVWHNCLTQHARLPFNGSEPRTLRRTQIHYPGTYHG